ncbi:MAG: hypothetical protein WKF42_09550 [Solirubrobacteraceae bacterium]
MLIALSQGWTDSIGLLFTFVVLLPVIATVCVVVMIVSGRGEKADDHKNAGRWGRRPPTGSA